MQYILKIHFNVLFCKVGVVCCSQDIHCLGSQGSSNPLGLQPLLFQVIHSFVHFMFAMFQVLCLSKYQLCLCVHP